MTFSGNEKIELSSFWKTESFILFGRNHAHKKNSKSKPKTKCEQSTPEVLPMLTGFVIDTTSQLARF